MAKRPGGKKKRRGIPLIGLIRLAAFVVAAAGASAGVLTALNSASEAEFARLFESLRVYLDGAELSGGAFSHFVRRALAYSQPIAAVWFLAFIPPAVFLAYGLLFVKAAGLAFTAAVLWTHGGDEGLRHILMLVGPQVFLLFPVFLHLVCASARHAAGQARASFVMRGAENPEAALRVRFKGSGKNDYAASLLLGLLASVTAAFVEAFILL